MEQKSFLTTDTAQITLRTTRKLAFKDRKENENVIDSKFMIKRVWRYIHIECISACENSLKLLHFDLQSFFDIKASA